MAIKKHLISCPSCQHRQDRSHTECEICGLVFAKHMSFTPIKVETNRLMSPSEIAQIRKTQDRLSKSSLDIGSKMELLIHCHKEKLLDLATHHLKEENDTHSLNVIKKLVSSSYSNKTIDWIKNPFIIISAALLAVLLIITLMLRSYI